MNQNDTSKSGGASGEAGQSARPGRAAADKARAVTNEALEEIKLAGNQLVDRVRDLIEEGNVRRIVIKKDEKVLLEVPLTVAAGAGAAVVLLSPVLAALGALAALVADVTLLVEREPEDVTEESSSGSSSGKASGSSKGSGATGQPTETPASKPETDREGKDQARSGGGSGKTIGR